MQEKPKKIKAPQKHQVKNVKTIQGKKENILIMPKWTIAVIMALAAFVYYRALGNGFAVIDDDDYIFNNPFIRDHSFHGIKAIFTSFYLNNYHPLTTLTYLFEYTYFGVSPLPYHLVNVVIHLLNIFLVFKLVEKISGKHLTALIAAALFALSPMHVESVAWISERKDVLYTLFYLSSLWMYLKYIESGFKLKNIFVVLLLFIASLLSKSAAVTLPVMLIAIDIYKRRKITAGYFFEKIPFFLFSLAFGIIAIISQKATESLNEVSLSYGFIDRIFLVSYTIMFYLVKAIVPFGLSAMHYFPKAQGSCLPWMCYASFPLLIVLVWFIVKRSSFRRELLFGFSFFIIALSTMIYVPMGNAFAAERYTYVPYIGLFFVAGQWISGVEKRQLRNLFLAFVSLLLIVFSFITWNRIGVWKSGEVLFTDIIKKYPENYYGYLERGRIESKRDDYVKAKSDLDQSISLDSNIADAYNLRGYVYFQTSDFKDALMDYDRAVKLRPKWAEALSNRGNVYWAMGDMKSAMQDYNKAIKLDSASATVYLNRGILKANTGNAEEAILDINKSIALLPENPKAYSVRGNLKRNKQDYTGAIADYNTSLKLSPDNDEAYYNRGNLYLFEKDTTAACSDWQKAVKLGNKNAPVMIKQYCH